MGLLGTPGWVELLIVLVIVLVVVLLLFGRRLPEVARSLGHGIVEFNRGIRSVDAAAATELTRADESKRIKRNGP